jgi:hypothetical protein
MSAERVPVGAMGDGAHTTAVVSAVTGYLEAWAGARSVRPFATKDLARAETLLAAARPATRSTSIWIRDVAVERVSQDAAVASVDATYLMRTGGRTLEHPLSGPVRLVREGGDWHVASFVRGGWPVAPILLDERPTRIASLAVAPRVVDFRFDGTVIVLEAQNDSDQPARLVGVRLVSHRFVRFGRLPRSVLGGTVAPGETIYREALVPPLPKERHRARLVLRIAVEQAGRKHAADVALAPARPGDGTMECQFTRG